MICEGLGPGIASRVAISAVSFRRRDLGRTHRQAAVRSHWTVSDSRRCVVDEELVLWTCLRRMVETPNLDCPNALPTLEWRLWLRDNHCGHLPATRLPLISSI